MPQISTTFSPEIHYQKKGKGPALVLLHGFPESSQLWEDISEELSATYTLLMPDFPGSGSSVLAGSVSISQMADAVKGMMEAEGLHKAVIAGHSMGGYIALAFAHQYPGSVIGLSLIHSTPLADDEEKKTMRRKAIDIIRNGGKEAFIKQMVAGLFSEQFKQSNAAAVQRQVQQSLLVGEDGLVNYYEAMIGREERVAVLRDATYPVQWIIGEADSVIPYKKVVPFSYISPTNFVSFYRQCAHMSMYEAPAELKNDLWAFTQYCYRN